MAGGSANVFWQLKANEWRAQSLRAPQLTWYCAAFVKIQSKLGLLNAAVSNSEFSWTAG